MKYLLCFVAGFLSWLTPPGARLNDWIYNQQIDRFNDRKWPYHRVEEIGATESEFKGRDWRIF